MSRTLTSGVLSLRAPGSHFMLSVGPLPTRARAHQGCPIPLREAFLPGVGGDGAAQSVSPVGLLSFVPPCLAPSPLPGFPPLRLASFFHPLASAPSLRPLPGAGSPYWDVHRGRGRWDSGPGPGRGAHLPAGKELSLLAASLLPPLPPPAAPSPAARPWADLHREGGLSAHARPGSGGAPAAAPGRAGEGRGGRRGPGRAPGARRGWGGAEPVPPAAAHRSCAGSGALPFGAGGASAREGEMGDNE